MGKFIINAPEHFIQEAATIMADVLRDYPTSKSCGVVTELRGAFYVRRTKTGASITHLEPIKRMTVMITDEVE